MAHTTPHDRNVLGAFALALADDERALADAVLPGADPALATALVTVANFAPAAALSVLATSLGLSHSGTVRLVDRLVDRGLAERVPDPADARAVRVRLTADGTSAAARLREARDSLLRRWTAPLDDEERATLAALVGRMLEARTTGTADALRTCRLCDPDGCGHPGRCPVTQGADRAEGRTR